MNRKRLFRLACALSLLLLAGGIRAADCNSNGAPDEEDLTPRLGAPAEYALQGSCMFWEAWGRDTPVLAADMDSDGDLDLVTANCGHAEDGWSTVSVLLNAGDGTFGPESLTEAGLTTMGIAAGDLDGDGDPDLACASYESGDLRVLLNRGDATFSPGAIVAAPFATEIVAADLDGDGDLDLAVAKGNIAIFLNAGDGNFSEGGSFEYGANDLALSDIDGDGDIDLLASDEYVRVFRNAGNATFAEPAVYPRADMNEWTHTLLAVDLTGDGYPEIATADYTDGGTPNVSVLKNDGTGGFLSPAGYKLWVSGEAQFIAAGDLNLDGAVDIAAVAGGDLVLLTNEGDGTLDGNLYSADFVDTGVYTSVVAVSDLDGDGRSDVVVKGWGDGETRRILLYRNEQVSADRDRNGVPDECERSIVLVEKGDEWKLLRGLADPPSPSDWRDPAFDDATWETGRTGIGYGDGDDATVLDDMQGRYVTVYCRRAFEVPQGLGLTDLRLAVDYDDGFIAYLNGAEVARSATMGSPGTPFAFDQPALATHEAGTAEWLDLGQAHLLPGRNVLAVEVRNSNLSSTDLSFIPRLVAVLAPPRLELTSAEARAGEMAEMRVLLTSGEPVQAFSLGVAHDPAIATLAGIDLDGCDELQALNGGEGPSFFAVDLSAGTQHCSHGEGAGGAFYCIASRDHPETETIPAGSSIPIGRLVYRTAESASPGSQTGLGIVDCLGDELPWNVVVTIGGASVRPITTPGILRINEAATGFRRGDVNEDGSRDISDAVGLLLHLFAGRPPADCRDAADANDDGQTDISDVVRLLLHLFADAGPLADPFVECGIDSTEDSLPCRSFRPCAG